MSWALIALWSAKIGALEVGGIAVPPTEMHERDCYALSHEVTQLIENRPRGTNGFWTAGDTRTAGSTALFAPIPAAGYLGYRAYWAARDDISAEDIDARVRALRDVMATKRCFVR
ncbi:MAG: hypothetical protein AAF493_07420 [Pseudomonadota bacterium]